MPRWDPSPEWQGEDAYIVGGGPSLKIFDWDLIRGKNTIGCNSAFVLGAGIVKINVFADTKWWNEIGAKRGSSYAGRMVGCLDGPEPTCPWLSTMPRLNSGLGRKALGFNGNSGSLAINLALILGAQRVFLLGFDMKLSPDQKANWHDVRYEPATASVYPRFIQKFLTVARDLPRVFPGREVFNVTDDSELDSFPKITLAEHFEEGIPK